MHISRDTILTPLAAECKVTTPHCQLHTPHSCLRASTASCMTMQTTHSVKLPWRRLAQSGAESRRVAQSGAEWPSRAEWRSRADSRRVAAEELQWRSCSRAELQWRSCSCAKSRRVAAAELQWRRRAQSRRVASLTHQLRSTHSDDNAASPQVLALHILLTICLCIICWRSI